MPIIDVITATSDAQLTTTGFVKLLMGSTTTADDATLNTLITAASKWAQAYVGYPLVAQRYHELTPSYGSRRLMLARSPIRSIKNGPFTATDTGSATELDSSSFRVNREAGMLDRDQGFAWDTPSYGRPFSAGLRETPNPGQERPIWFSDYIAGYTYGGIDTGSTIWSTRAGTTSTGRTLPEDIEQAVALKVVQMFEGNEGVMERAVGDLRVRYGSFGDTSKASDPSTSLLNPYRRIS